MKTQTPDETHSLYKRALAHAHRVLALPLEEIKAKLKDKTDWTEDRIPTPEEMAILILKWAEKVGAK
jgi:hypothetical protein